MLTRVPSGLTMWPMEPNCLSTCWWFKTVAGAEPMLARGRPTGCLTVGARVGAGTIVSGLVDGLLTITVFRGVFWPPTYS